MQFEFNKTALAVAQALACIALTSCGGANEDTGDPQVGEQSINGAGQIEEAQRRQLRSTDTTAPIVSITS